MSKGGRRPLIAGALALATSGAVARVIGALYRIALVRTAGDEVLGLFQMTMPLYHLAIGLATMGFHIAIVRLVADSLGRRRPGEARAYIRFGLTAVGSCGALVALLLWFTAPLMSERFFGDPRLTTPIAYLGFLLVPAAVCAVLRGSVQGWGGLSHVALANTVEAALRVPGVLILLSLFLPLGMGPAAAAIVVGMVVGEVGSLFILGAKTRFLLSEVNSRRADVSQGPAWNWRSGKALFALGLPVMVSNLLNNTMSLINAAMVPKQLMIAGLSQSEATGAFGQMSGMVVPMLYMPMVLIAPITQVIIPAVAERMAQNRRDRVKELLQKAFLAAGAVSLVSSAAFWFIPQMLGQLLYGAPHIADLVRPLAAAAPFVFLGAVAGGTLYGLGRTGAVMINVFAGNVVRFLLILVLVSDPAWGILGAVWALVADCAATAILNLSCLGWLIHLSRS